MQLIKRAPGDAYTLSKFFQTLVKLKKDIDSFYLWSLHFNPYAVRGISPEYIKKHLPHYSQELIDYYSKKERADRAWVGEQIKRLTYESDFKPPENFYRDLIISQITKPRILLGIKDHLTPGQFDPWIESHPWLINPLLDIFRHHKNKQFILLTSMENLESYIQEPNVTIVPWGGDISNHLEKYKTIEPVIEKDFNNSYVYLSLNRHDRNHRLYLISLLLGLDIDTKGLISCMFKEQASGDINTNRWNFKEHQQSIKNLFQVGYEKISTYNFPIRDSYEIYGPVANDNVSNFNQTLRKYYQQTFVEFITETSYTEKCFNITEKTANSILGCNFPIWISSKGTVEFLRSTGMDVFDDVVNHDYDNIENPVDRLYRAVTDNTELLTDIERTKKLWKQNRQRFLQNVEYFRKDLWNFYGNRLTSEINKIPQFISNGSESLDNGWGHRTP
jgi:hypothetical protein